METNNIDQKVLLVLGSNMGSCDIVQYARELGAYTIVADNLDSAHSPAKQFSDEAWKISTANLDELEKKAKESGVTSVFAGISDFNVEKALSLSERLRLPFYCTRDQWNTCSDKTRFKELCVNFGVPVVEDGIIVADPGAVVVDELDFPLIVKPVDSGGGKGIRVCRNKEELMTGMQYAFGFSTTKTAIIEPYINDLEVTLFYAIQDGAVFLTGMSDRYTRHRDGSIIPLPVAHLLPSLYLDQYLGSLNKKVVRMLKSLKLENGMVFIQGFANGGEVLFYEMGYRLTGTQEYHILERECGVNTMKMMINHALFGEMHDQAINKMVDPRYRKVYCLVNFLIKPGIVGKIIGAEIVSQFPGLIKIVHEVQPGDVIPDSALGTLRQIALRVFAEASDRRSLATIMERIHRNVEILSSTGESMLLEPLDVREINFG